MVWVVRNNKLYPVSIETGANNGINVEVLSGLKKGDVVAIDYSAEQVAEQSSDDSESSPFAPKRPGQNKKEEKK